VRISPFREEKINLHKERKKSVLQWASDCLAEGTTERVKLAEITEDCATAKIETGGRNALRVWSRERGDRGKKFESARGMGSLAAWNRSQRARSR